MGEFRIGRLRAYATYPEPRFTGLVGPFAQNGAAGPGPDVSADPGGTVIPWSFISSTAAPGTNIPITPKSTKSIVIEAVLGLHNVGVTPEDVTVQVLVDGTPIAFPAVTISVPADSFAELPLLFLTDLATFATANITVVVTGATSVNIVELGSILRVYEVPIATG